MRFLFKYFKKPFHFLLIPFLIILYFLVNDYFDLSKYIEEDDYANEPISHIRVAFNEYAAGGSG